MHIYSAMHQFHFHSIHTRARLTIDFSNNQQSGRYNVLISFDMRLARWQQAFSSIFICHDEEEEEKKERRIGHSECN